MCAPLVIAIGLSFGPTLGGAQTSGQADETLSTTSIQRIRAELERTTRLTLDVAGETPHFQIIIREPQRFRDEGEEVKHAIEEYCEAQPDRGAGIQMCSISLEIR